MANGANLTPKQVMQSDHWERYTLEQKIDTIAEFLISGYGVCHDRLDSCKKEFVTKRTVLWIGIVFLVGAVCLGVGVGIITWKEAIGIATKRMPS